MGATREEMESCFVSFERSIGINEENFGKKFVFQRLRESILADSLKEGSELTQLLNASHSNLYLQLGSTVQADIEGFSLSQQNVLHFYGAQIIANACQYLQLPITTCVSAQTIFHRFYTRCSFLKHDLRDIAMGAVFLAGKAQETIKKPRDIAYVFDQIFKIEEGQTRPVTILDDKSFKLSKMKNVVQDMERVILKELGFEMYQITWSEQPHRLMYFYINLFKPRQTSGNQQELFQLLTRKAFNYLNDSYKTSACVYFPFQTIVASCIYLAFRATATQMPPIAWWTIMETSQKNLRLAAAKIIQLQNQLSTIPTFADIFSILSSQAAKLNFSQFKITPLYHEVPISTQHYTMVSVAEAIAKAKQKVANEISIAIESHTRNFNHAEISVGGGVPTNEVPLRSAITIHNSNPVTFPSAIAINPSTGIAIASGTNSNNNGEMRIQKSFKQIPSPQEKKTRSRSNSNSRKHQNKRRQSRSPSNSNRNKDKKETDRRKDRNVNVKRSRSRDRKNHSKRSNSRDRKHRKPSKSEERKKKDKIPQVSGTQQQLPLNSVPQPIGSVTDQPLRFKGKEHNRSRSRSQKKSLNKRRNNRSPVQNGHKHNKDRKKYSKRGKSSSGSSSSSSSSSSSRERTPPKKTNKKANKSPSQKHSRSSPTPLKQADNLQSANSNPSSTTIQPETNVFSSKTITPNGENGTAQNINFSTEKSAEINIQSSTILSSKGSTKQIDSKPSLQIPHLIKRESSGPLSIQPNTFSEEIANSQNGSRILQQQQDSVAPSTVKSTEAIDQQKKKDWLEQIRNQIKGKTPNLVAKSTESAISSAAGTTTTSSNNKPELDMSKPIAYHLKSNIPSIFTRSDHHRQSEDETLEQLRKLRKLQEGTN